MTEFQAVDLDAVLDQFEFNEETRESSENVDRNSTVDTGQTSKAIFAHASHDVESNLHQDLNKLVEKPTLLTLNEALNELSKLKPSEVHVLRDSQNFDPDLNGDEIVVQQVVTSSIEMAHEPRVRLNSSQPDVLSGCINTMSDSITDHLENWNDAEHQHQAEQLVETEPKKPLVAVDDSPSSTGTDSQQTFESIYDQYASAATAAATIMDGLDVEAVTTAAAASATEINTTEDIQLKEEKSNVSRPDPMESLLAFKAEELTDDELNLLLEQLEANQDQPVEPLKENLDHHREMGARPKETSRPEPTLMDNPVYDEINEVASNMSLQDSLVELSSNQLDSSTAQDCVTRPTSLQLTISQDNSGEQIVEVNEDTSSRDEESLLNVNLGPPGSTPANPMAPSNVQIPELLQGLSEDQLILGKIQPFWVPDAEAMSCMICEQKFTLVKRRHHCRACGKVLCSLCCADKFQLPYLEDKEARVCKPCKGILERLAKAESLSRSQEGHQQPQIGAMASARGSTTSRRPNPANPMEYCSTVPPIIQAEASGASAAVPPVMVPVSVLKRFDSTPSSDPKQVMFSDGIRPGGDLAEMDEESHHTPTRRSHRGSSSKRKSAVRGPAGASDIARSMIPPDQLPYVSGRGPVEDRELGQLFGNHLPPVPFILNRNLRVYVSLVMYSPISNNVWNFRTQGLTSVGQDEVVILLVQLPEEPLPPREIFEHLQTLYENAGSGSQVVDMGHSVVLSSGSKPFLGSNQYGGFLYFRHTFQAIDALDLPPPPFLFAVLLTKWEMPWARVFPLRLLLRLGAEARYYPAPLWSTRLRQTVYKETGNTIMKLLSDFRNFTYSLPIIRAMVIHMEDKVTTIIIPKNSYSQIQRALQNSNDPVLALGANFSSTADSHLVAVQRDEHEPPRNPMSNSDYETQAINILNKPRKVTGASFIVLNGALKSSAGLTAKSSIVEDGIMVQVSPDRMSQIRKQLNNMEDCRIDCGPVGVDKPDETVFIRWIENDQSVNAGIKSVIDGSPMDGILSIRVKGLSQEFSSGDYCIRWSELFFLPVSRQSVAEQDFNEPPDPSRVATHISKAVSSALLPHLNTLIEADLSPIAVRVHLDPENASYEAGSGGQPLPQEVMNSLDNQLIPIVHGQSGSRAGFELVFHILNV